MTKIMFNLLLLLMLCACAQKESNSITTATGKVIEHEVVDSFFVELMENMSMPGLSLAIINDAEVIYHRTWGVKNAKTNEEIKASTFFEAASLSKPLFAYFVMKQVDKGLIELDRPLYQYLEYPDIEDDEMYKKITARMILSHTSGFPNWRTDQLEIQFTPGAKYQYSGEGYRYLADVVATVNDINISELDSLFQVEIAQPLKARNLYFKWNEFIKKDKATGHQGGQPTDNHEVREGLQFGSAGGLHTEAYNYAKFLCAVMEDNILEPATKAEMLKEQVQLEEDHINKVILNSTAWSLGFGMIPTKEGLFHWHSGNNEDFQSWFHLCVEKKYGIVLFSNSDKVQDPSFFIQLFDFLDNEISFDISQL